MALFRSNGKILRVGAVAPVHTGVNPYNPLNLPPFTVRCRFTEGATPYQHQGTWTRVSEIPNVWDCTYETTSWASFLYAQTELVELIGANTEGVTNMQLLFGNDQKLESICTFDTRSVTSTLQMFFNCISLVTVPFFETQNVTHMGSMFSSCSSLETIPFMDTRKVTNMESFCAGCISLKSIPLFDVSSIERIGAAFDGCTAVETGALALYNALALVSPEPAHYNTFTHCGIGTVTGRAELEQIPTYWGGLGPNP